MLTSTRRLVPVFLAGLLLVPLAGPAMAETIDRGTSDPVTAATLAQAELDLVTLTNSKRSAAGLVVVRKDPDLMAIARTRAEVTFDKLEAGWRVVSSALTVRGRVPGSNEADFEAAAQATKDGCPISVALAGNVALSVEATLES